jgi:flagellar FliL protein
MSAAAEPAAKPPKAGGRKKLLLLALPLLLGGAGAGLWFGGVLPPLLGMGKDGHAGAGHGEAGHGEPARAEAGRAAAGPGAEAERDGKNASGGGKSTAPVFVDLPEMITNLNAGPRRTGFLKLHAKLELARAEDQSAVTAAMPRLIDLFQTYLRELRPEELRGAAGTYRLREELIARAGLAAAPAQIVDVLFTEMLVQ